MKRRLIAFGVAADRRVVSRHLPDPGRPRATHLVSESMQSIASITTESAAGARETSRAVEHLVTLSDDLTQAIARFRFTARG